jgi:hypothetical protein
VGTKLRKVTLSVLLAGSAAVLLAPPAEANRGNGTTTTTEPSYVPPYGQTQPELPDEDPYADPVDNPVEPTVVPVDLPAVTDPNAGLAGGGEPLGPVSPSTDDVLGGTDTASKEGGFLGGVLSRTGAESLPLARAGVGALVLGAGLVILSRRRRADAASA